MQRISDLLKKVCEFAEVYDFLELAEKEGKYRYILASIGSTGYEVPPRQKQEIEQNLLNNEKKLAAVEKEIVRKMGDLLEVAPQADEAVRELSRVRQLVEKRVLPALREGGSDDKLAPTDALTAYFNLAARKEREGKLFTERIES